MAKSSSYDPNPNPFDHNSEEDASPTGESQALRHPEYYAKYDVALDEKQYRVQAPKESGRDVNPKIRINYDGKNFKDTKGPRSYNLPSLKEEQKRGRFLFVTPDQYDPIPNFTAGPAYLAAVLENNDYHVEIFHGTCYHLSPKDLERFLSERPAFDYIGIGYLTNYVHDVIEYCRAIRSASPSSKIILGCNGFSPLPAFYLAKTGADYGVSGEAEDSLLNLLNALSVGESVEDLPSIAFRDGDDIFVNELRQPVPDITKIPWPAYHLYPIEKYVKYENTGYHKGRKYFVMLTSRGCPYVCNFCYRLEEGHRHRPFDDVLGEMHYLNDRYTINDFGLQDELFMTSKKHVKQFCENLIAAMDESVIPRITWSTTGRLNIVDREIADVMAAAGCRQVLYGLESGDTKVLELMNKKTTAEAIREGVNVTREAGMAVSLPCMFGNIGETEESIQKTVDLLIELKPDEYRTLRPVTPYPGSPLYEYAMEKNLLKDHEEFFQLSRNPDLLSVNFTEMNDEAFYKALYGANEQLVEAYHRSTLESEMALYKSMYFKDDDSGFVPPTHGLGASA
jgi:anaerobic magnesium-protoporphyrin IX monomethyl ester cyclase